MKTAHSSVLPWIVTLTASLFFFYEFVNLNMPNALNTQLMQDFHLDAPGLGWLVSMYFWGNIVFLFPAGNLLDRFSTKKLVLIAMSICTTSTFVFSFAKNVELAAVARFCVGLGSSFCLLSCIRLASRWFPPNRMAFVTGLVVTMAMIGGFVAQSPMVLLSHAVGWRHAVFLNGVFGVMIALAIFFIVQDRPPHTQEDAKAEKAHLKNLGLWRCIKLVFFNRYNWFGGIYTSLLNLPVFLLGGLWGVRYLVQVHHLPEVQASYATSLFFVGIIFGSPAFGWFSDRIARRRLPMLIGGVLSLLMMLTLMYAPNLSLLELITLFFLIGFVTSSQVLTYPTIAELNPIALTGTAVGVASLAIMGSGTVFDPLFGWLLERHWDRTVINNVPIYSVHDFNTAMWIMPIAFVVALLVASRIRETYCESQV